MEKTWGTERESSISENEVRRLVDFAGSFRDRVLVKTLYYTGMRRDEVCNLAIADVDLQRRRLVVGRDKVDRRRIVPIPESLASDLRALLGRRKSGPVFVSQRGRRLAPRTVNYIVAQAGRRAGLSNPNPSRTDINPRLLRDSFAQHYLKRNGAMHSLAHILGHASVATTYSAYGKNSERDVSEEYDAISRDIQI